MTSVHSFVFDGQTRIGDDPCGITEKDLQNQKKGSYITQNYFEKDCGMKQPVNFATSQPNVFYNGGYGITDSCNVDTDSKLRIGGTQTNPKCRITLQQRPFLTVPFLGRGPAKPVEESRLLQGGYTGDKKSCKNLMEKSLREEQLDLVPSLKASIQNPANLCEDVAADGWIRGGLPSRELSRDKDYFSKH